MNRWLMSTQSKDRGVHAANFRHRQRNQNLHLKNICLKTFFKHIFFKLKAT